MPFGGSASFLSELIGIITDEGGLGLIEKMSSPANTSPVGPSNFVGYK